MSGWLSVWLSRGIARAAAAKVDPSGREVLDAVGDELRENLGEEPAVEVGKPAKGTTRKRPRKGK